MCRPLLGNPAKGVSLTEKNSKRCQSHRKEQYKNLWLFSSIRGYFLVRAVKLEQARMGMS